MDEKPDNTRTRGGVVTPRSNPTPTTKRGRLRALYDWLLGGGGPSPDALEESLFASGTSVRFGRYTIVRKLGQGGMGVVYEARDERLGRSVALKMLSSLANDETSRKRFWREARAAAAVSHPNACQIHEIGEEGGELFIAMELLGGEALADRLRRGPLSVAEALPIGLGVLAALAALHARGIVHRDLKPSNVFLTPHGAKLLDFGLARPSSPELSSAAGSLSELTQAGVLVGTPRYMAPEQVRGEALDARCDLFAVGAMLFEMLAGRPAFGGRTAVEILHATLHEQPPALSGSPAVAAADRVIRRALAKRPEERPASAEAMAEELRAVRGASGDQTPALARALMRIVVLPFRVLRADPETDFLAFSLADAIATSLSGIGSLVVRSSAAAARFAGEAPDLRAIAEQADVDRIVMGTLLRSGGELRATAQLVEAPGGTLLTSHTVQTALVDLFRLQDDIARRVVEALALPLGGTPSSSARLAPQDARAYELFLRANELARSYDQLPGARDLYQRCLELDPGFAPAWAQLGRCHRVIAKFIDDSADGAARAEEAFGRALALDPRLPLAHKFYAHLEAEIGKPVEAVVRLLGEAARHGNDPELFAGLVHACRYCGLYDQSIASHQEARRLDPNVPTSLEQTVMMTGDVEALLAVRATRITGGGDAGIRVIGLGLAGRREEAREALGELRSTARLPIFRLWTESLTAWLEGRSADLLANVTSIGGLRIMQDPEAIFQLGWLMCDLGELERGLDAVQRAVAKGYSVVPTLSGARAFDPLHGDLRFQALVVQAETDRVRALAAFREAGGERLLGR